MPFSAVAPRFDAAKLCKVPLFDAPGCFFDLYCLLPGQSQAVHSHGDADKFYYVIEGRGRFTLGDEVRELGPGEAAWAPRGVAHGVGNAADQPLVALTVLTPRPGTGG